MSLFGKKKEAGCGRGTPDAQDVPTTCCGKKPDGICCVKVLGSGCKNCHTLYENVKEAAKATGLSVEIEYITDLQKVMEYGVMSLPALIINEQIVSMGKVLKTVDIVKLLK